MSRPNKEAIPIRPVAYGDTSPAALATAAMNLSISMPGGREPLPEVRRTLFARLVALKWSIGWWIQERNFLAEYRTNFWKEVRAVNHARQLAYMPRFIDYTMNCLFGRICTDRADWWMWILYNHCREVVVKQPMSTSYNFQQAGGVDFIPVGERVTFYFWRGYIWIVWKEQITSCSICVREGVGTQWDYPGY